MQKHSWFKVKGAFGNKTVFEEHYIVESARAGCMLGDAAEEAGWGGAEIRSARASRVQPRN